MKRILTATVLAGCLTAAALGVFAATEARADNPSLQDVEARIEASVDARLHDVLHGFIYAEE